MRISGLNGMIAAAAVMSLPTLAQAQESLTFTLNWLPKADHAAYFYAKEQGWYADAGLDVTIEGGRGSGSTVQKVGAGASDVGVADFATILAARGRGADLVGVMNIYTISPVYFYWLKSSGITGVEDFAGHTIGAPSGDVAVSLWPVLAARAGIDPETVKFANVTPPAKLSSLKSGAVDIIPYLYDAHDLVIDEFGDEVQFVGTDAFDIKPYGITVFANGEYLAENPKAVETFVQVSQKAFDVCTHDFDPCLEALKNATSGLNEAYERKSWERMKSLMNGADSRDIAFGWIDGARVAQDYDLVSQTVGIQTAYDPATAFTVDFLSKDFKFDPATVQLAP